MKRHWTLERRRGQRGQILIIVGLALVVVVGMVGLTLDSGRGYAVKAKLNAAVDAASIAAARALAIGDSDAARISNAQAAAQRFFDLNYPAEYMGAPRPTPSLQATRDVATRRWTVTVSAMADMPTTFARVLGRDQLDVRASGTAVRRQLDVILVMDTSGSLGPPWSPSGTFTTLKNAAINGFINKFSPDDDRVGLVSFSSSAWVQVPIRKGPPPPPDGRGFDKTTMVSAINNLNLGGATSAAEGMRLAINELDAVPASVRSDLRVILFFSDGAPNIVGGVFPRSFGASVDGNLYSETESGGAPYRVWRWNTSDTDNYLNDYTNITSLPVNGRGTVPLASYNAKRTLSGTPYTNSRCNVNRAARNMVENLANTARSKDPPIYVYSIGLGGNLETLEITFCGYSLAQEKGATILNRLANSLTSDTLNNAQPKGQYCYAPTAADLERCFSSIASEVLRLAI